MMSLLADQQQSDNNANISVSVSDSNNDVKDIEMQQDPNEDTGKDTGIFY